MILLSDVYWEVTWMETDNRMSDKSVGAAEIQKMARIKEAMDEEKVHVFSLLGVNLAYCRETGSLFTLDDVARDLAQNGISSHVLARFGDSAVCEAIDDMQVLFETNDGDEESVAYELSETNEPSESSKPNEPSKPGEPSKISEPSKLSEPSKASEMSKPSGISEPPAPSLKALCLNVAHDCNLMCTYCFAAQGRFGGKPEIMSKNTARKSVDFLVESSRGRHFLDLDFFGGEPLLAFDVVKDTVEYGRMKARQHGKEIRYTLTTNCTLMTDEIANYLAKEGISLILSLDGKPEIHDRMRVFRGGKPSHRIVLANALKAVQARGGRDYWVRGTYTKYNLNFAEDVKYLYNQGFRYISLEPAVGEGEWSITESDFPAIEKSYEDLVRFWEDCYMANDPFQFYHFNLGLDRGMCMERRETGCGAGYEYVTATPSGEIFACHQLVGKDQYRLGSVLGNTINAAEATDAANSHISALFRMARVPNKVRCRSCWAKYLCGGGCHARAIEATGDIMTPDPLTCQMLRKRMEYALYVEYVKATR